MRYLDISFPTPQENILFDDVLLHLADKEEADDVLRFWESFETFVVLGRICKEERDLNINNLLKAHIPVIRRSSGGGTVLQGRGCLNFSLVLHKDRYPQVRDLRKSYEYILQCVVDVLGDAGIQAQFLPISDVALTGNNKKISGNAQKRGRNCILHHGTLLYGFELGLIEQYLRLPQDQPLYRRNRSHLDFVANAAIDPDVFKAKFSSRFGCKRFDSVAKRELDLLKQFCAEKAVEVDLKALTV